MAFHASDDDTCKVASFCGLLESLRRVSLPVTEIGGVVIAEPLNRLVIQSDGIPCQRRRYLQSSQLLRLVGIVAQSEFASDRDRRCSYRRATEQACHPERWHSMPATTILAK